MSSSGCLVYLFTSITHWYLTEARDGERLLLEVSWGWWWEAVWDSNSAAWWSPVKGGKLKREPCQVSGKHTGTSFPTSARTPISHVEPQKSRDLLQWKQSFVEALSELSTDYWWLEAPLLSDVLVTVHFGTQGGQGTPVMFVFMFPIKPVLEER